MNQINAPAVLKDWFATRTSRWRAASVQAALQLSADPDLNKAGVTLETPRLAASVTVWGTGMVEFIVLDQATSREVVISDIECSSMSEVLAVLERCADDFERL